MKKRIIPIVAILIIALIAITTVIFALVPVNYKPEYKEVKSFYICDSNINSGAAEYFTENDNKEYVAQINKLYNEAFSEHALASLFNGRLGYNAELIKNEDVISNVSNISKYICLEYTDKSNLPTATYNNEEFAYDRILIKIESLSNKYISSVNVYLLKEDATSSSYYYKTYGNFYNFFDYINNTILAD